MKAGPPLSIVTCPACYAGHSAEVDYDPATRRFSIFCAEAGRVGVADKDLATVRPNLRWLPDQLTQLLRIRPSPPRRTLIDSVAWWLGDTQVGQTSVSVALAVCLRGSAEVQQLADKLGRFAPPNLGMLLVAGDPVPAYVSDLTQYRPIPIQDMIRVDDELISVDRPRLEAWIRGLLRGRGGPAAEHAGRPTKRSQILMLFDERRLRGQAYNYKLREAVAIIEEWILRFPDESAPSVSAIRSHLPDPKRAS